MRTLIFFLLSLAAVAQIPPFPTQTNQGADSALTFDSAHDLYLLYLVPRSSVTLNAVRVQMTARTGTADVVVDLVEGYSINWAKIIASIDTTADTVTINGHGYTNGDRLAIVNSAGSDANLAGMSQYTLYYVCSATTNTFKLDDNADCASNVDLTGALTGSQYVRKVLERQTYSGTPTVPLWLDLTTSFTTALTEGTNYYIVIQNGNSTPGSNNFAIRSSSPLPSEVITGSAMSNTAGATMNPASAGVGGWRVAFSGGAYWGVPVGPQTTRDIYGTSNWVGSQLQTPAGMKTRIKGIGACRLFRSSSPTEGLRVSMYTGQTSPSLVTTSGTIPDSHFSTNATCVQFLFSSVQEINPETWLTFMFRQGADGGTSTNKYTIASYDIDNTTESKALLRNQRYASYNGSTWTFDDTEFIPIFLILDTTPFASSGTGGGASAYVWQ